MKFYLYNNLHWGDNLYGRALAKKLIELDHTVVIGCYKNMEYIFRDMGCACCGAGAIIDVAPFNEGSGDLAPRCPEGCIPIDTWLGHGWRNGSFIGMTWKNMVELFNEQSPEVKLSYIPEETPFLDFSAEYDTSLIDKNCIYIDNSICRGAHSSFVFDLVRMAKEFPKFTFICTSSGPKNVYNIVDYSHVNLVQLSNVSEKCGAIFGKGSGPYVCTLTSKNIDKPRALCGLQGIFTIPNWPHPKDTTRYLNTMDEVMKMLKEIDS